MQIKKQMTYHILNGDMLVGQLKETNIQGQYIICAECLIDGGFPSDNSPGRPDRAVKEIMQNKSTDFQSVFSEFSDKQGIYGFGDSQVKAIYDRHISDTK